MAGLESIIKEWLDQQINPKLDSMHEAIEGIKGGVQASPETLEKLEAIHQSLQEIKSQATNTITRFAGKSEPELEPTSAKAFNTMLDHAIECRDGQCYFRDSLLKHKDQITQLLGGSNGQGQGQDTTTAEKQPEPEQPEQPEPEQPEPEPARARRFFA